MKRANNLAVAVGFVAVLAFAVARFSGMRTLPSSDLHQLSASYCGTTRIRCRGRRHFFGDGLGGGPALAERLTYGQPVGCRPRV